MKILPRNQHGQALLIVLLTLAVTLTVVLSVVSRSVTDITVSTYEEDALRAFSAAEAGIEEALLKGSIEDPVPVTIEEGVTYDVKIEDKTIDGKSFRYPKDLVSGETATFWFASHNNNGELTCSGKPCFINNIVRFCWGNPVASTVPAIEVMFYYDLTGNAMSSPNNYANVKVKRSAYDKYWVTRGNYFNDPTSGSGCNFSGDIFAYRAQISVNTHIGVSCQTAGVNVGCPIMAKVRMYYANINEPQKLGIEVSGPTANIPPQGLLIDSKGIAGESTRRINVFQGFAEPPAFFDTAVFSRVDLVKQ